MFEIAAGGADRPSVYRPRQFLLYTAMITIWGSSFFFTDLALRAFTPLGLILARFCLAAAVLATVAAVLRLTFPRDIRVYGHLVLLGAINIALPYAMITHAQVYVNSSMAIVLSSTTPLFVFLISVLILRSERFSLLRGIGIAISLLGVALLNDIRESAVPEQWFWPLVIVLASVIFGAGNVYSRRYLSHLHPIQIALFQIGFSLIYIVPITSLQGPIVHTVPGVFSMIAILELGILGSALGYILFFHFILTWGSTAASVNTYLQPLVGIFLGVLVLHDTMQATAWASLGVVLAGVFVFGFGSVRDARRSKHGIQAVTPSVPSMSEDRQLDA